MDETSNDECTLFTLPKGATGFFWPKDGPLPETDLRAFRTALYVAARTARGGVGEVEEQAYPRTFHTATIVEHSGETVVLCHAYHPWIAFTRERQYQYTDQFIAPPPWASAFTHRGFMVLMSKQLATPLRYVDTDVLSQNEWREIRFYGITTLGGVLFNAWD
ncbi:hypothetical protein [Nocardia donostiensis]|uniref:Uncharacterized protein n=1 Tax=Nocardia donostiensis TaxID=1538463 RepID=A0A1V2T9N8_9NOCA|nr:hypothetical protein [Nocardia donostiensis]ONM46229.1 hypothetical protein B0T46_23885 [Nocardia donostiensis]OQS13346.1 hypothetical protein B0T36_19710 [Nocardia donostiensis]OQS18446.1 hypothetical protein B0T44_19805 [Nocardia donostiensis]